MEKTIEIDGKQVSFKSTAATPLRYKAQFGRDYFSEILKMEELTKIKKTKNQAETLAKIDFNTFYNIIWVLAKTADKKIPEPLEWLDTFEEFPLFEIIPQIQDLIVASIKGKKK
ncbi:MULTISPECIES: hypothetical protein [Clostridium]|uniref:Phage protein n=1 Tax=Clostridium butyricum TaxID=1492 RepID=A0A2S7F9D4_CLOBU|nr:MULTISPECIES: hypothetical protein [Clostridium]MSA63291.1 hypothetical protein [Gordonibacter pamelaeae]ALS16920.1 hypothetical protein ATD26_08590 [Clostridium butyricum]KHD14347.1 prophage pi2 protein 40 [Clostridium butyricum]KJZ83288.1 Phage protein [Clostridium sp. IBUN125C]KJZ90147.1 Phage protein [Clostridium sp. IBUN13A]